MNSKETLIASRAKLTETYQMLSALLAELEGPAKGKYKLLRLAAGLELYLFNLIVTGFAVAQAWQWFLVPLGAPGIGRGHAVGLAMLAKYLTGQPAAQALQPKIPITLGMFSKLTMRSITFALVFLGACWIAKHYI